MRTAALSTTRPAAFSAAPKPSGLKALSVPQLAGQRIIYAYRGLTPPGSLLKRIRHGEAAGVIFFANNIASKSQLRTTIQRLQSANASSPIHAPLLMMLDQEGGQVRRLPGAPEASEKRIGQVTNARADAREAGSSAAANLARAGLNVNLAPVLDVFRRPEDFIDQYERSYSSCAQLVSQLGRSFI
jgi:beta-N-acetylhexosaminidase